MTLQDLIEGFEYLSPGDGAELNGLQEVVTFELEDVAPQEPRIFDLKNYAEGIEHLSQEEVDEFIATCSRPNPKRKVRRNGST